MPIEELTVDDYLYYPGLEEVGIHQVTPPTTPDQFPRYGEPSLTALQRSWRNWGARTHELGIWQPRVLALEAYKETAQDGPIFIRDRKPNHFKQKKRVWCYSPAHWHQGTVDFVCETLVLVRRGPEFSKRDWTTTIYDPRILTDEDRQQIQICRDCASLWAEMLQSFHASGTLPEDPETMWKALFVD